MKLSVCLATFNEEKFIRYPLDSTYDIADEVIIVDGGSSDKTLEIAASYGDKIKIINTDNPPMFHINKQKALDAAQGDWILQLDADEALSPELKKEILDKIASAIGETNLKEVAFWIPRKNFFLTRFLLKGGQYPDYTVRFYKKNAVRFPCKSVHENVELNSNQFPEGKIGYLKEALLHYADPEFSRYLHRWDRYTTLDAELIVSRQETVDGRMTLSFFQYFFWKPFYTFFMMYLRHKGFMDGFPGFVFSLFSAIRFWLIYIKVWLLLQKNVHKSE